MGCTTSTPTTTSSSNLRGSSQTASINVSATERVMNGRIAIDKTERIKGPLPQDRPDDQYANNLPLPKLNEKGQLTEEEVQARRSGSGMAREIVLGDLSVEEETIYGSYAVLTQRGYHLNQPHKPNQDDYHITAVDFAKGQGDALFAVFDGHGAKGHDCASYAKSKFPIMLASNIQKARGKKNAGKIKDNPDRAKVVGAFHPNSWPKLTVEEYERCCRDACLRCNKAMHEDSKVIDTMAGTTAIAVSFHAGKMTITNLGDSRAVLGYRVDSDLTQFCAAAERETQETISNLFARDDDDDLLHHTANGKKLTEGDIVAVALSEDQTPYRKDERERLKSAGARICTIDQMEGKEPMHENWEFAGGDTINYEGNIPRVWCEGHNYPGTAFTRSLGDSIAQHIGVSAEPEIITKRVTRGDEYLVIATDGIFEFLTNQNVIDICAESSDPSDACTRLVDASYEKWLLHETRTDDITCIVVFLKNTIPNEVEVMRNLIFRKHQVKGTNGLTTALLRTPEYNDC